MEARIICVSVNGSGDELRTTMQQVLDMLDAGKSPDATATAVQTQPTAQKKTAELSGAAPAAAASSSVTTSPSSSTSPTSPPATKKWARGRMAAVEETQPYVVMKLLREQGPMRANIIAKTALIASKGIHTLLRRMLDMGQIQKVTVNDQPMYELASKHQKSGTATNSSGSTGER